MTILFHVTTPLILLFVIFCIIDGVRASSNDADDSTLQGYLRIVGALEQDVKRRQAQESKAEAKITTIQADAARAAIATLDAQLLHARSLVQLATYGSNSDSSSSTYARDGIEAFFRPSRSCEMQCAYACEQQLGESQIVCLQIATNCLRRCRRSRNAYRPLNVTELSLAPRLPTFASMRSTPLEAHFNAELAAQVRELVAQRLRSLKKRPARQSGAIRVRLPVGTKPATTAAAVMECPVPFEVAVDTTSVVDIVLLASEDSSDLCRNAGMCVAIWNNASRSDNTRLLLATEEWPTCADEPADKIPLPAWRNSAEPFVREKWLKPSRTRRHAVFVDCDGCNDAPALLALSKEVQLVSSARCVCVGASESERSALEHVVDVSRSNRADDAVFFALFGTHQLLAAYMSGAVPIVFPLGLDMKVLPSRSVLLASDFEQNDALGRFVTLLLHDEAYYRSFHQWRTDAPALRHIYSLIRFAAVSPACRLALVAAFATDADPLTDDESWQAFCESARVNNN